MEETRFKRMFRGDGPGFFSPHKPWTVAAMFGSELMGTCILVFFGCMGLTLQIGKGEHLPHFACAMIFGLVVMMVIQISGHCSEAHVNPAVSLCSLLLGRMRITTMLVYWVAQICGALLGVAMLKAVTPENEESKSACCDQCVTKPGPGLSHLQAFLVEFSATAVLIFVVCGVWDKRLKTHDSVAIKLGLAVGGLAAAAGAYTGCSMNPARSFAPAIWAGVWTAHWVYWAGPFAGSIFATLYYMYVMDNDCERAKRPEDVPLSNVDSKLGEAAD